MNTRFTEKNIGRAQAVQPHAAPSLKSGEGEKLEKSLTINRSPEEVYSFWRNLENLPQFMTHIESITDQGNGVSHWTMKTTHGRKFEWDAKLIEDKRDEMLSWQSLNGADIDNAGSVWFTPTEDGQATVVKVLLKYSPPGGIFGAFVAKMLGDGAEKQMVEDLERLKSLLESQPRTI